MDNYWFLNAKIGKKIIDFIEIYYLCRLKNAKTL